MAVKITIKNVKGIKNLEFYVPRKSGVYLLVGPNGAGKTTLLTCLDRMCNPLAFARNFVYSNLNNEVDQYKDSEITYESDSPSCKVSFRKGSKRWSATPRDKGRCLSQFGFESTVFIQADSGRIAFSLEEIRKGSFEKANKEISDGMNTLFETGKFDNLKKLKNKNGRGKKAKEFYVVQETGSKYYSEKRFSTGELALLRLVEKLVGVKNESLILLDEAELALHPRIQKNLLDYLKSVAQEKALTIIVATHSVTMIKSIGRDNILMLEDLGKGKYEVVCPCYPARAIGCVDFIENSFFDALFFVEDDMAKLLFSKLIQRCKVIKKITMNTAVIPIGSYLQTAEFAVKTRRMLFNNSKVFAVLDDDVFSEAIHESEQLRKFIEENKSVIFSLGCTPEVWIVDCLNSNNRAVINEVRDNFCIEIKTIISSPEYGKCKRKKPRALAKDRVDVAIDMLTASSGKSREIVLDKLAEILVNNCYTESAVFSIVMPMLSQV